MTARVFGATKWNDAGERRVVLQMVESQYDPMDTQPFGGFPK